MGSMVCFRLPLKAVIGVLEGFDKGSGLLGEGLESV